MKRLTTIFIAALVWAGAHPARGADLTSTASVNVTSDTSANAKTMAFNEARRQILADTLGLYVLADQFKPVLAKASNSDLTNLIASSSIDGERISDTTYSANITMTVDRVAAQKWLSDNNVQNWLADGGVAADTSVVVVTLRDLMADWMTLNRIARDGGFDLGTRFITGHTVTLEIPSARRRAFMSALASAGWRYSDTDGMLRVWR